MTSDTSNQLTSATSICAAAGVVLRKVAGEAMLVPTVTREVDLDSLFLLNATGVFLWERMKEPVTLQELAEALVAHCHISIQTASVDVQQFAGDLIRRKLAVTVEAVRG